MELLSSKITVTAGESLFLKTIAAQGHNADTLVATFASNSGAMVAGYKSKLVGIDYEVTAGRVPDLEADQIITIGNESFVLQPKTDPATGKANKPKAPVLKFEVGARTMTLGLLQQGQGKTTVTFIDGTQSRTVPANELKLSDLSAMVGKIVECKKYWRDESNPIIRSNARGEQTSKTPANCYELVVYNS